MLSFGAESVFSSFLSKNLKITIYRNMFLSVVLYGRETWSLILRKERTLKEFPNRVLRRIFVPKRDEVKGSGENYTMRSLMISSSSIVLVIKSRRMRWAGQIARMEESLIQGFGGKT